MRDWKTRLGLSKNTSNNAYWHWRKKGVNPSPVQSQHNETLLWDQSFHSSTFWYSPSWLNTVISLYPRCYLPHFSLASIIDLWERMHTRLMHHRKSTSENRNHSVTLRRSTIQTYQLYSLNLLQYRLMVFDVKLKMRETHTPHLRKDALLSLSPILSMTTKIFNVHWILLITATMWLDCGFTMNAR